PISIWPSTGTSTCSPRQRTITAAANCPHVLRSIFRSISDTITAGAHVCALSKTNPGGDASACPSHQVSRRGRSGPRQRRLAGCQGVIRGARKDHECVECPDDGINPLVSDINRKRVLRDG